MPKASTPELSYATNFINENNIDLRPTNIMVTKDGFYALWTRLVPDGLTAQEAGSMERTFRDQANEHAANQRFKEANEAILKGKMVVDIYLNDQNLGSRILARTRENNIHELEEIERSVWSGEHPLFPPDKQPPVTGRRITPVVLTTAMF